MSRTPRFSIWLPFASLICALSTGLWALVRVMQAPARYLPDGNVLRLEGVTYGKQHALAREDWWQKLFLPFMPTRPASPPLIRPRSRVTATANALVFWTSLRPAGAPSASPMMMRSFFRSLDALSAVGIDDEGREFGPASRSFVSFNSFGFPEMLQCWELPVFPRRGKGVGLRLFTRDAAGAGGWSRAAEFVVGNPTPGPYPVWRPEPLPVTRHDGDWEFTLTGLAVESVPVPRNNYGPGPVAEWTRTRMAFQVRHLGRRSAAWEPGDVTLSDATGNLLTRRGVAGGEREGREVCLLYGGLPADEPAWKVRVAFRRCDPPRAEEEWTIRGIPLPAPGTVTNVSQSASRGDVALTLHGIAASRTRMPGFYVAAKLPAVHVRVTPPEATGRVCLTRATDGSGRTVAVQPVRSFDGRCSFGLELPAGARRVDLTFAVRESRTVEFVAKPRRR